MKRKRWLCLGLVGFVVATAVVTMLAMRGAAEVPSVTEASLASLKASFYGMCLGPNPYSLEEEVARNAELIRPILSYGDSSPRAREELSARLLSDLDSFSSRFAPGTQIDEGILRQRTWEQGEAPWDGLTVDAYLLLEMASSARSPAFTKQVLQSLHATQQGLSHLFDGIEKAIAKPDAPGPPQRAASCPPRQYGSRPGAELAWCCEQFMVEADGSGAFTDLPDAQAVIAGYRQWRATALAKRGEDRWLPVDCAGVTMEYVGKLAAALPQATSAGK